VQPLVCLLIPNVPVAVAEVALAADHELLAADDLEEIEFGGPDVCH
jgi:hypothetical protein